MGAHSTALAIKQVSAVIAFIIGFDTSLGANQRAYSAFDTFLVIPNRVLRFPIPCAKPFGISRFGNHATDQ